MNLNIFYAPTCLGPIPCVLGDMSLCVLCVSVYAWRRALGVLCVGGKSPKYLRNVSFRSGKCSYTLCSWESCVREQDYFWNSSSQLSCKLYCSMRGWPPISFDFICAPKYLPIQKHIPLLLSYFVLVPAFFHGVSFVYFGVKIWSWIVGLG